MPELKKVLTFKTILLITINSIMGTGIFFLPAVGAAVAGPASILSWVILSFIAIYIGMCFAELSSMFPEAGGIYEFCKQAYGNFWAFMVGWVTLIAGNVTIAMLVVGAIQYLLPIHAPVVKILLSLFFVIVFNVIAYKGMKTSAVMLTAFSLITVGTLLALIIPGLFSMKLSNLTPFFTSTKGSIFVAIFFIAETFFGWETATFLAGETKDGERVMPKALIYSTIIIAIMCLLFVITSLGVIPWETFGASSAPLSDLGRVYLGNAGGSIFTILVYLSIIGSVAGWIVSAPRLILAMAKDKLFLGQLAKVHPVYNTPYKAIIFQTIVTSILIFIGAGSYKTLLELLVPLVLVMYSAVLISLVVLRYTKPNIKKFFKVPFGKIGPILVVFFNIFLFIMWFTHSHESLRYVKIGASITLIGIPMFFLIELYNDPRMIRKINDFFARFSIMFEKFSLPKFVIREVFGLLGDIKNKSVLEFGCNEGALTLALAEEVGPLGKVYATNISSKELEITRKRLAKEKNVAKEVYSDVELILDLEHTSRVHPSITDIDAVISVGSLSYLTHFKKVLKEMNELLPERGRICLIEYVNYLHVLPDAEWLSDEEELKKIFKDLGFSIQIKKRHWLFWDYLFIYGIKTHEDLIFV
jgi:basic amino acid/polyamine antiporter, APA family